MYEEQLTLTGHLTIEMYMVLKDDVVLPLGEVFPRNIHVSRAETLLGLPFYL